MCVIADSPKHTFTSAFEDNDDGDADDDDREGGRGGSGRRMTR